jgi:hypothetical protein
MQYCQRGRTVCDASDSASEGSTVNIHTGKCPKCDQIMHSITVQGVTGKIAFGKSWNAISYQCPHCHTVLSVEIDPIALKSDIVGEVTDGILKMLPRQG